MNDLSQEKGKELDKILAQQFPSICGGTNDAPNDLSPEQREGLERIFKGNVIPNGQETTEIQKIK